MLIDIGLVDYEKARLFQKDLVSKRKRGEIGDSVILVEHEPVFTIGRTGRRNNILKDDAALLELGLRVVSVERGGDVTFHGLGQLVVYPVLDLKKRGRDLHKYLRDLEELAIRFLARYSVPAYRVAGKTGVWTAGKKIVSIGIASTDWITFHGLSVNINVDLDYFSMIYPCGMRDVEITSVQVVLGRTIDMQEAKRVMTECVSEAFNIGTCDAEKTAASGLVAEEVGN